MYVVRGYQGARYTSWRPASRLVALPEGEQGCSEADFQAVPVGAALGLADRALVARGGADMADPADTADTASVDATSAWWSVRLPCCSTDRRTPSRSCSVCLRRPTVRLRRRKRLSNLRLGSWPVAALWRSATG